MRRISIILAVATTLLIAAVAYTLEIRIAKEKRAHRAPVPAIKTGLEAVAPVGWRYEKDDPQTNRPIVRVEAKDFQATHDPSTFELHEITLRLYDKNGGSYTYVASTAALFEEGSGQLKSEGAVTLVINVPADQDAADKRVADKHVRVETTSLVYESRTGKASTDKEAKFAFTEGDGQGVGAEYDPNTKILHLKSQVALNWIGRGPVANKMHIETADLVYKEAEQKVYLSPWAKLQRQGTTIQSQAALVTLQDGYLHQVDADHAFGTDVRDDRKTDYSADKMTALFDDAGNLINIVGQNNAHLTAREPSSQTTVSGDRADLRFAVAPKQGGAPDEKESNLHLVLADGHATAESSPIPQPGVQLPETRILRSEHIELEMRPDGRDLQEIRTVTQSQLEFKPNRPDQSHRVVDCSRLRVSYGEGSYIDTFMAWNVATHTDRAESNLKAAEKKDSKPSGPPPPALTWSDQMITKFAANSNQVARIEQTGNFRYQEGTRRATAKRAVLEQTINKITLIDSAKVLDDTGSAVADTIVMNQATGDMDATGHVFSTHEPNRNQKPGTSMLDDSKAMQAQADAMTTRDNNTRVHYQGHAVIWQGANRTSANVIDIDREAQSLDAHENVVSEVVDKSDSNADGGGKPSNSGAGPLPIFTVVCAPELAYRDDTRLAHYTGGVKLTRDKMVIDAREIFAYLTPKTDKSSNDSSLDHASAEGNVVIDDQLSADRTRTGKAEHAEYFTKLDKVVLSGGSPQVIDSYKGVTRGQKLTYFNQDDRLIVEGEKKQLAYTQMKKK